MSVALTLPNWEQLRDHVQRMLCDRDRIDFRQSSLVETTIYRSGRPCGVMFQLRGPRLVQTHAIWSADENRLLYYDSRGVRFADEHLAVSPAVLDGIANLQSIQSACVDSV
jgi:hypothetical protein